MTYLLIFLLLLLGGCAQVSSPYQVPLQQNYRVDDLSRYSINATLPNGKDQLWLVDTGAQATVMPQNVLDDLEQQGLVTKTLRLTEFYWKGKNLGKQYYYQLQSLTIGECTLHDVLVIPSKQFVHHIIGAPLLRKLGRVTFGQKEVEFTECGK